MGPGETIAAVAMGCVMITVLITIGFLASRWIDYKRRKAELEAQALSASRSERQDDYVELLEERVRVLERIATDGGVHLAAEIEGLRGDTRKVVNLGKELR